MKLKKDWWDIALAVIVVAIVCLCYGALASIAGAAPVCRQQVVAHQYAAPLVAPVLYKIGHPLQQEAADTLQFRHSEEYQELRDLRNFRAGIETAAIIAQGNSGDRPSSPAGLATKGSDNPAGAEQPSAPPANDFAGRYPTLAAKCQKCHSGDTPKGDIFLDGTVPLDGPDAAAKRDAIARAIVNERMPDGKPLEDQEQFNALVELFTEPVSGETE